MSVKSGMILSLASLLGPLFIRVHGHTWTLRTSEASYFRQRKTGAAKRVVYSLWHRDILVLGYFGRGEGNCVLISQHRDGELIARVVLKLGYQVFRGSTTRGALKALRALDRLKDDPSRCDICITPDGPKGPRKKVQKGVVYAAARTGFPIVPVGVAVNRCWEVNSWDRFRIPKPFSRCFIQFGGEIAVPPALAEEEMDRYREKVEEEMERAEALAVQRLQEKGA